MRSQAGPKCGSGVRVRSDASSLVLPQVDTGEDRLQMKGSLRHDGLSRLQSTDDLRLVVDRDASFHLALLELRCGTADEHHVLSFHLLQRAFRYCKRLFAEFGWKLDVGEHIRLEA